MTGRWRPTRDGVLGDTLATQTLLPSATATLDGGWSVVGAATAHAALGDADDASYVEGQTDGDEVVVQLQAGVVGVLDAVAVELHMRAGVFQLGAIDPSGYQLRVDLLRGSVSVLAAPWDIEHTSGDNWSDHVRVLTPAEVGAIAPAWNNLFLSVEDLASPAGSAVHRVSEVSVLLSVSSGVAERTVVQLGGAW